MSDKPAVGRINFMQASGPHYPVEAHLMRTPAAEQWRKDVLAFLQHVADHGAIAQRDRARDLIEGAPK